MAKDEKDEKDEKRRGNKSRARRGLEWRYRWILMPVKMTAFWDMARRLFSK